MVGLLLSTVHDYLLFSIILDYWRHALLHGRYNTRENQKVKEKYI